VCGIDVPILQRPHEVAAPLRINRLGALEDFLRCRIADQPGAGGLQDATGPAGAEAAVGLDLFDDRFRTRKNRKAQIRPVRLRKRKNVDDALGKEVPERLTRRGEISATPSSSMISVSVSRRTSARRAIRSVLTLWPVTECTRGWKMKATGRYFIAASREEGRGP
jgi:hypothetical protein